ncbi:MAG: SixA phosphatase family protein [Mycobacteriales bacterium]
MADRVLVLVRHAKAVAAAGTDALRPLTDRGHRDARAAGQWLAGLGIAPDLAVVSPTIRAQETWADIAHALPEHEEHVDHRIYDNTLTTLLEVVADVRDTITTLVLVGHNPSMHGLAVALDDGDGDDEASTVIRSEYPTCGIAIFDVSDPWQSLGTGSGRLRVFEAPRG